VAELSTIYPNMAPMEGFDAGLAQSQQVYNANQNNKINQAQGLQSIYRENQMLPLDMQKAAASTRLTNTQADTGIFDLDQKKRLAEPTYQTALAKLSAETSEAEVKTAHAQLEKDMLSPNPNISGPAVQKYKMTGDMLKMYETARLEKDKSDSNARIHAGATVAAANISASASKYSTDESIKAGKYANHAPWFMEQKLMGTPQGAISVWEGRKNEAYQQMQNPNTSPDERKMAEEAYNLALQSENTARQQAGLAATAGASVNAAKSPNITAIGSGQGLQSVPAPTVPGAVDRRDNTPSPNVPVKSYNSEATLEADINSGKVKPGDIVTVNGRKAKIH